MIKYKSILDNTLPEYEKLCNLFGENIVTEAITKPLIIHYADKIKPWQDKDCIFANYWWQYAKKSNFLNLILIRNLKQKFNQLKKTIYNKQYDQKHQITTFCGIKIKTRI